MGLLFYCAMFEFLQIQVTTETTPQLIVVTLPSTELILPLHNRPFAEIFSLFPKQVTLLLSWESLVLVNR